MRSAKPSLREIDRSRKMPDLKSLSSYIDDLLYPREYEDYCINGIQVEGKPQVEKIIIGVSASEKLFLRALDLNADCIIVHHGIFWKNSPHPVALTGFLYKRLRVLIKNDISLLVYHLPLDGHPELGNNAIIADRLGLKNITFVPIGSHSAPIAAVGDYPDDKTFDQFAKEADKSLDTEGIKLLLNDNIVKRIFVLSGSGSGYYEDAVKSGADLFVTGELREDTVRTAEELGLNFYAAGHYNSEKWGINALGSHLQDKFDLTVEFVDVPNPV